MGRRGLAPANRGRRHVLQIGPISKHQPTENNRRSDVRPVGEAHENTASTQVRGLGLLNAYGGSGSEDDEDEIDDQVKDFLKELQEDDDQQPSAAAEAPSQQVPTYDSNSVWHECLDPSTQHVYYWNTVTDEVTWTFPENGTVSVAPAAGAAAATEEQTAVEVTCEPGPSGSAVQLRGEASGTTSSTDEHGSNGHLEEMDDDSDCNIENYDDDDDDDKDDDNDNEGTAQVTYGPCHPLSVQLAQTRVMPTVSKGEVSSSVDVSTNPSSPAPPSIGCEGDINIEHCDDEAIDDCEQGGVLNTEASWQRSGTVIKHVGSSTCSVAEERCGPLSPDSLVDSTVKAPASERSSNMSSPQVDMAHAEDTDSDCNITQYDDEDEAESNDNTSDSETIIGSSNQGGKGIFVEEEPKLPAAADPVLAAADPVLAAADPVLAAAGPVLAAAGPVLAPYNDQELPSMLFADSTFAQTYGSKDKQPSSSSMEGTGDDLKPPAKARALTLLKPRSVARTNRKKPSVPKPDTAVPVSSSSVDSKESRLGSMTDMFADENVQAPMPADTGSPALQDSPDASSPTVSRASSSAKSDDLGDFDIDAALEESFQVAQRNPGKRSHADEAGAGKDDMPLSEGEISADEEEPAKKRQRTAGVDYSTDLEHAKQDVTDMDIAAESDVEHETNNSDPKEQAGESVQAAGETIEDQLLALASNLSGKLKFLNITSSDISNLHLALVRAETRLADWQAGALDGAYAVQMLEASVGELQNYEEACAPPGWQCLWDSSASRYYYHEIATGTTSWNYPSEIAKLAPQQSYGLSGLDEMAAAAFAGAMAATYHGYIYGGYQAMYTPGVSQQPVAYAPPLPVEELPPPPPGVDDPPMPSDPPPPPPPPDDDTDDDDQPPTPGDEPPPLPPGVELQGPSADVSNSEAKSDTKAEGPVVIQAAPAIIKRAAVVDSQPNSPSSGASTDFKISTDDPLQMRMRATLLARGMSEADVKEYFIQEALKQQLQQSGSQPASPKTTAVGKSKEKKKKKDKSAKHGLAPKKQKNMASLVNKWDAIRQKELEEENADSDEEDPVKVQQRKIQEWKASQMAGGGAHNNPNFEEVSGDWRDRIKRSR